MIYLKAGIKTVVLIIFNLYQQEKQLLKIILSFLLMIMSQFILRLDIVLISLGLKTFGLIVMILELVRPRISKVHMVAIVVCLLPSITFDQIDKMTYKMFIIFFE